LPAFMRPRVTLVVLNHPMWDEKGVGEDAIAPRFSIYSAGAATTFTRSS
jgi:hypothetical protein